MDSFISFFLLFTLLPIAFLLLFSLSMAAASFIINLVYWNYGANEQPATKENWRVFVACVLVVVWAFVLLRMVLAYL